MDLKLFILLLLVINMTASAQPIIHGKVIDEISHQPLEAVTVTEENVFSNQSLTDQYGNFYLKLKSSRPSLIITSIGYKLVIYKVDDATEIKIALKADPVTLKNIVLQANGLIKFNNISKIDLDLKPVGNSQELLRIVPGLFIAQHAGGGKAEQIFLRGFDCDHGTDIAISVDGIPINMVYHAHGQGYADTHFIIPETINNIDFGAGPYYTQHGNFNTAGYVAFSTYNNIAQSRIQIEGGLFNSFRTLVMLDLLKKNKDRQSAYVAVDYYYTNGPFINKQNFSRFNLFGKYNLAISNCSQLSVSISSFKSKWDASGQVPSRAIEDGLIGRFGSIDPSEGGNTERYNSNVLLSHTFSKGITWENQFYYTRYKFNLYSDFSFFLIDSINGDEINQRESRNLFGYSSRVKSRSYIDKVILNSIYGAGFRYDATTNTELAHVSQRRFLEDIKLGDILESNIFGYIDEQISLGKWLINVGTRFDHLHFNYLDKLQSSLLAREKSIMCPKLIIQYSVNSKSQVYLKTGKSFHSNDTRAVIAHEGEGILPFAYGVDMGYIAKPTNKLLVNLAFWYLYMQQEFVYNGDDANIEPSGKTERNGIDLVIHYQFCTNLFAIANVNLTKPRALDFPKGRNFIPLAPTFSSTGGIYYKQKQRWNGSFSYRYLASRPANENGSIKTKSYFIVDGSFNYTRKNYELGIAIENLLNTKWNEAQFATESRLKGEIIPVTELNFTPGIPLFAKIKCSVFFL